MILLHRRCRRRCHRRCHSRPGTAAVPGGLQRASAMELLAKTVELMHKEYAAGGPYRDLAAGLWERLARLGADCADGRALLLDVSSGVVDRLPKAGARCVHESTAGWPAAVDCSACWHAEHLMLLQRS